MLYRPQSTAIRHNRSEKEIIHVQLWCIHDFKWIWICLNNTQNELKTSFMSEWWWRAATALKSGKIIKTWERKIIDNLTCSAFRFSDDVEAFRWINVITAVIGFDMKDKSPADQRNHVFKPFSFDLLSDDVAIKIFHQVLHHVN